MKTIFGILIGCILCLNSQAWVWGNLDWSDHEGATKMMEIDKYLSSTGTDVIKYKIVKMNSVPGIYFSTNDVWVEVNLVDQAKASFSIKISTMCDLVDYTNVFIIEQVTMKNVDQKIEEIIALANGEIDTILDYKAKGAQFIKDNAVSGSGLGSGGIGTEVTVGPMGPSLKAPVANIWVEIPAIKGEPLGYKGRFKTYWVKTAIKVQGTLYSESKLNSILVTGAEATLWGVELSKDENDIAQGARIKIGTLQITAMKDAKNDFFSRMSVELFEASQEVLVPSSGKLGFLLSYGVNLGLAFLDKNKGVIGVSLNYKTRIGILIQNQLFIGGFLDVGFSASTGNEYKHLNLGPEIVWQATDRLGIRLSATYVTDVKDKNRDPMFILPEGWNFAASAFMKF